MRRAHSRTAKSSRGLKMAGLTQQRKTLQTASLTVAAGASACGDDRAGVERIPTIEQRVEQLVAILGSTSRSSTATRRAVRSELSTVTCVDALDGEHAQRKVEPIVARRLDVARLRLLRGGEPVTDGQIGDRSGWALMPASPCPRDRRARARMTRALRSTPTICTLSSEPISARFRRDQGHRQALSDRVAIAAGGHEADHRARSPDRLVAGRVRIERVDFERDQLCARAAVPCSR